MVNTWMFWNTDGYGLRWIVGDRTAQVVTGLPEVVETFPQAEPGGMVTVDTVAVDVRPGAAGEDYRAEVLSLPALLDAWHGKRIVAAMGAAGTEAADAGAQAPGAAECGAPARVEYVNVGALIDGDRPLGEAGQKYFREMLATRPERVVFDCTHAFGPYAGRRFRADDVPAGLNLTVAGPDPYGQTSWWVNVRRDAQGCAMVWEHGAPGYEPDPELDRYLA